MNPKNSRRRLQFSLKTLLFIVVVVSLGSCIFVLMNELNRQKANSRMERARAEQQRAVAEKVRLQAIVEREAAESNAKLAQEQLKRATATSEKRAMELAGRALAAAGVTDEQAEAILQRLAAENASE